jgi:hypothetical protein
LAALGWQGDPRRLPPTREPRLGDRLVRGSPGGVWARDIPLYRRAVPGHRHGGTPARCAFNPRGRWWPIGRYGTTSPITPGVLKLVCGGLARWDSNPAPGCFAVQGRDGERPLTCDAGSPTLTASARRGPAVPDAVRTQRGPGRRATASLGSAVGRRRWYWSKPNGQPEPVRQMPGLTAVDRSRPFLRARGGHAGLLPSRAGAPMPSCGAAPTGPSS